MPSATEDYDFAYLVGFRLRCARLRTGCPQQKAAAEIKVSRQTLGTYERDATTLSLIDARRLCALYGVSIDWICREPDEGGPVPE